MAKADLVALFVSILRLKLLRDVITCQRKVMQTHEKSTTIPSFFSSETAK